MVLILKDIIIYYLPSLYTDDQNTYKNMDLSKNARRLFGKRSAARTDY